MILGMFGTTPGKALAGIRVETLGLTHVPIGLALRRNLLVYLYGFYLALPLANLFAFARSRDRLENENATRWDDTLQTSVFDRGNNGVRTCVTAAAAILLNVGMTAFGKYAEYKLPKWQADQLVAELPEMNRGLPTFLDDITRYDRVDYIPQSKMLIFYYTLIHRDATVIRTDEMADPARTRAALLERYCGPIFAPAREQAASVHHRYHYADGSVAFEYVFNLADCSGSVG